MIISHKHKFIFLKATKVAGTSIEIALSEFCDKNDIITGLKGSDPKIDSSSYDKIGNYDIPEHIKPKDIKKIINEKIWNEYLKITVIRNPWDLMVSRYYWENKKFKKPNINKKKIFIEKLHRNLFNYRAYINLILKILKIPKTSKDFNKFMNQFDKNWSNYDYYFDKSGNKICDVYIRFEHLETDYKKLCEKLNVEYKPLPKTKDKARKEKKHYSNYYNKKSIDKVSKIFKKEIKEFNYKFEYKN